MRNLKLISDYRLLDKDLAMFSDKLSNRRDFETNMFVPHFDNKEHYYSEIKSLEKRVNTIENPDDVFGLIQSHMKDFITAQKLELKNAFEIPSQYINGFLYSFSYMVRTDSRSHQCKADVLIKQFSQADIVWNGIKTWIKDAKTENLKDFINSCQMFIDTMSKEISKISIYFANSSEKQQCELVETINELSSKMKNWSEYVKSILENRGIIEEKEPSESDTVKLEESLYRSILSDRIGVNLDEILSWYEEEIEKTRNEVFEIAAKIKMSDSVPSNMTGINELLLKYAGPCDTPDEMYERANAYIKRTRAVAREYVKMPENEMCFVTKIPEEYKLSYPWGGYSEGCHRRRPLQGEMFLNNYNYKAVTDGWIKMNTVHEAYPGHHVQFIRTTLDPIPETFKMGTKYIPLIEGTAHRSERVFEFIFPEDQFYPLFVAYRRHHTSVRIKADLMLRYFGNTIEEVVKLYMDELGFDYGTARGQVRAQENSPGYFTSYYYGMKKLCDYEKKYGYDKKTYTELLFSAGYTSLENFEKFLKLSDIDKQSFTHDFASMIQFK